MHKTSKIIALLLIIGCLGFFIYVKVQANGPDNSYFNQNQRLEFSQNQLLREIFGLHYDGDARADYLGKSTNPIYVRVFAMQGIQLDDYVLRTLRQRITSTTGKSIIINIEPASIPYQQNVTEQAKNALAEKYLNIYPYNHLDILLLSRNSDQPLELGVTYRENGMVIYNDSIGDFTAATPQDFDDYQLSTILHEFGHQLGLQHNTQPNCLMNADVEQADPSQKAADIVTDFCAYEKNQIAQIASHLP